MAITRLDPRVCSRYVDAFASLVGRRESMAPPFCISRRVHLHCGAVAYSSGNSSDPGIDARCRARRSGNGDAAWNSRASRRQSYSREQRPCRRERGVQRNSFVADVAHDRPALRRSETTLSVTTRWRSSCVPLSLRFLLISFARFFSSGLPRQKICPRSVAGMTLLATASSHSSSWPLWRLPICSENHKP